MKKILLAILLVILGIIVAAILYLGYLGFIPGLRTLFGSDKPRDLGVTYTQEDYKSAYKKGGVDVKVKTKEVTPEKSMVVKGSHKVKKSFTNAEITAAINEHAGNWSYYPVSDVQVRVNDDGSGEVSGYLEKSHLEGYARATGISNETIEAAHPYFSALPDKIPVYVKVTAEVKNDAVNINFLDAEVLRLSVPGSIRSTVQGAVNGFVEDQLDAYDVTIKSGTLKNGAVEFDGTLSESIETYVE
ncbi:MAG: hypothetical protein ABIG66_02680 [Candidatus Kerfeldbacteria bacterium]